MSDFSGSRNSSRSVFNLGILTNILLGLAGFVIYSKLTFDEQSIHYSDNFVLIMTWILAYFGALIGNIMRRYGSPTYYFTDGTLWGNIKKRFFWSHGPQLVGFFIGIFFGPFIVLEIFYK